MILIQRTYRRVINDFLVATALLTAVPVPIHWFKAESAPGRSLGYFPAVGLGLGMILAAAFFLFRFFFTDLVAAALVISLWAILTGALHLEGLADAGDGLGAAVSRDKRLEIMHDPRLGSFGAVTLILLLILKFAAVASLKGGLLLVLAPVLGRWAMVLATRLPLARKEGMAARMRDGVNRREIVMATVTAALVALFFGRQGLLAGVTTVVVVLALARLAQSRLGGLTGDIYGAIGEVTEAAILIVAQAV